ncbi:hypothetical protein JHK87_016061 [Glycine soja]|nr:hypothetical protein JHK87_016061 [Glycine soja]
MPPLKLQIPLHFYPKLQGKAIFGVLEPTSTSWGFKFQVEKCEILRVRKAKFGGSFMTNEIELFGYCESLEGLMGSRVVPGDMSRGSGDLGDVRWGAISQNQAWLIPTQPGRIEPVQVIEVSSSEEDHEEDPEELPPEPAMDALDLPEDDEDPLPDVNSPEGVMSASEADSTMESGPGGTAISDDSSS